MTDSNYWPGGQNRGYCSRGVWEKKRFGVRRSALKELKLLVFDGFAARLSRALPLDSTAWRATFQGSPRCRPEGAALLVEADFDVGALFEVDGFDEADLALVEGEKH